MDIDYDRSLKIWGKTDPYQPLLYHLIDSGNIALSLLSTPAYSIILEKFSKSTNCPIEYCKSWLGYIVALHDIGKCDPDFQAKAPDSCTPLKDMGLRFHDLQDVKFDHAARSGKWLNDYFIKNLNWGRRAANTISEAIRGHHSRFDSQDLLNGPIYEDWDTIKNTLVQYIWEAFKPPEWKPERFNDCSSAGLLLSGLIVFSDWISSNIELMKPESSYYELQEYAKISLEKAQRAVDSLGLSDNIDWSGKTEFNQVWSSSEYLRVRPIQETCVKICRSSAKMGLVIIEAPMGEGKTEAAVYLATRMMDSQHSDGMYIALPTAATSNQMFTRIKKLLDLHDKEASGRVKLINGMAWLIDDATITTNVNNVYRESIEWFKPKKRSLLSPYSVGTIDQALMSALNVRFGFLRLFGLSSKVLIIDEVHAYDAYMSNILITLLKWCSALDVPVIMLSATLPCSKKSALIDAYLGKHWITDSENQAYPLITYIDDDGNIKEEAVIGQSRKTVIELIEHIGMAENFSDIAILAHNSIQNGGCTCVIMNTVDGAQKVYQELEKLVVNDTLLDIYHSRYTAKDRSNVENKVLYQFDRRSLLPENDPARTVRPKKAILVATQVVEQSLDIDFDVMITEIAPVDLILQRAGRLHRHLRPTRLVNGKPILHLILPSPGVPNFGKTESVYSRFRLLKTLLVLLHKKEICLPDEIKELVNVVYDESIESCPCEPYEIIEDELRQSLKDCLKQNIDDSALSNQYLISDPQVSEYSIAIKDGSCDYDEDEGGRRSYFNARTRIDNEHISILIINDDEFSAYIKNSTAPPRAILKELFLNMVNVPDWWLARCQPANGFEPLLTEIQWLANIPILRLQFGVWEGADGYGKRFKIIKDERLGIMRTGIKESGGD